MKYKYINNNGQEMEINEDDIRKMILYSIYPPIRQNKNFGFPNTIRNFFINKYSDILWKIYDIVINKLNNINETITQRKIYIAIKEACEKLKINLNSLRVITPEIDKEIDEYIKEHTPKVERNQKFRQK